MCDISFPNMCTIPTAGDDEGEDDEDDAKSRMTRAETETQDLVDEVSEEEDGRCPLFVYIFCIVVSS